MKRSLHDREILPGIEIRGLALYLKKEKTLVFGDLHLGYEEELNAQGFLVPRFQYREILLHLKSILSKISPNRIIINGDLKHEFGRISEQEWSEVLGLLDFLKAKAKEIVLIKGNHDTILGPLAERKELKIVNYLYIPEKKVYICHGHRIDSGGYLKKSKILIIAHDHPAISLREGLRTEKMKCFLRGKWSGKTLIQLPSLNFVVEGVDITREKLLSPFMENIWNFEAFCIEGERVFYFGKVRDINK